MIKSDKCFNLTEVLNDQIRATNAFIPLSSCMTKLKRQMLLLDLVSALESPEFLHYQIIATNAFIRLSSYMNKLKRQMFLLD